MATAIKWFVFSFDDVSFVMQLVTLMDTNNNIRGLLFMNGERLPSFSYRVRLNFYFWNDIMNMEECQQYNVPSYSNARFPSRPRARWRAS